MSSDEVDKKNVEENTQDTASSAEENEEKEDAKEEKVNNKAASKKKGADPPKIKQPAKKRVKTEQVEKDTKKEDKKEEKKKAESEDEESAEENDVENHKAVPLLDQPLEISGSRKRKEVQRFTPKAPEDDSKEVKIPEGKGKALGDIERIDFNIQRAKPEDLKLLHRLCFGKPGKAANVKKFIKKFSGFEFEEASDEFEKKKVNIEKGFKKVTVAHLKNICNIIDVEKGGNKDDILDRILKFLTCPVDSGKKLPGGGRSKRSGASAKNYDEGEESFKLKKKGKNKKKDDDSEGSENDKDEDQSEEEEEEEEEEGEEDVKENNKKESAQTTEESEPEEEEEKPKKGGKKGKKAAEAADKKAPPKKRAAAKKAAEKKSDSEADGDDESEDEEPLSKKAKTPPTDEEIKTYVKSLLEGANLELITMKKVCQDVYAHYPDFDLGHKKDFIKTTVKSLISS